jgi:hypothetical protein
MFYSKMIGERWWTSHGEDMTGIGHEDASRSDILYRGRSSNSHRDKAGFARFAFAGSDSNRVPPGKAVLN